MKLSNKKFSLLVYALLILLVILGVTTWQLMKDSNQSRDLSLKPSPLSGSMALLEEQKVKTLDFAPTLVQRLDPLITLLTNRFNLLTENIKVKASAPEASTLKVQSNKYIALQLVEPNSYQDMLSVRSTLSSNLFMKDFGERSCPMEEGEKTSSGTVLQTELERELVMHYFIQNEARSPYEFTAHSIPFHNSAELAKDMIFESNFPIYMLSEGPHTITATPGCTTKSGAHALMSEGILMAIFEKKTEPIALYENETNTSSLLRILSPNISTQKSGLAERKISYMTSVNGKATREDLRIPYIQSNTALTIKAESMLPIESSGSVLEPSTYQVRFDIFDSKKLVASALSQVVPAPQKNDYKATWFGNFSSLPKGEYTLITRLVKSTGNKSEIIKRNKVEQIGIGDIIMALGDDTVTGKDGAVSVSNLGNDMNMGRAMAQPSKECEFMLATKKTCKKDTRNHYGFASELGQVLTKQKGYPVLVLSEGAPAEMLLPQILEYYNSKNTSLANRVADLAPNAFILQWSPSSLPETANSKEEITKLLIEMKKSLEFLKNQQSITTYLSLPQFEERNSKSELFATTVKDFSLTDGSFMPGPNFYKLFFEELLSASSKNLYKQNAEEGRLVNDLGLKQVAGKWAEFLN